MQNGSLFFVIDDSIFYCLFGFLLIGFYKKLQKHFSGVLNRIWIIKRIVQCALSHGTVTGLSV